MGRKAKLKQVKKQQGVNQPEKSTAFVKELKKQGYHLEKVDKAPKIPDNKPEPEI